MTPSVSTSGGYLVGELAGVAVLLGVVGHAVEPASVDDADPGAGQDADGVRVVFAGGAGAVVDVSGPRAGVPAVVGEGGERGAESGVAGPAEADGAVLAGLFGDRGEAGEGGDGVGAVVGFAAVAPLGEHLGGVDLTRPWQRREDLPVRVLPEAGADRLVEVLDADVECLQEAD